MGRKRPQLAAIVPLRPTSTPRALDDAALATLVREREPEAVRELYRRYAALAERMIVRMLGLVPERADLLQDVFVRALEGIDGLRDASALRPWICGIAVRRAQEHRRSRRRSHAPLTAEPEGGADPAATLEARRVYALLDRLDEDERTAFVLRRIEGMELAEAAAACGVSLATLKRRVARAQERFEAMAAADPILASRLEGRRS